MQSPPWKKLALPSLFLFVTAIAAVTYLFHYVGINPQYDNQGLWNGIDLLKAMHEGSVAEFLLAVHKYPLFYMLHFTAAFSFTPELALSSVFLIGRLITFAYGCGIVVLLTKVSRKLGVGTDATLLLLTSILFLMFTSAIRPHIPVTFWTLAAFTSSLWMKENPTAPRTALAFGCALFAFCSLQNGLLAFIFPVWGYIYGRWNVRRAMATAAWLAGSMMLAVPLGYPFLLARLAGVQEDVGIDLGHNVGLHYSFAQGVIVFLQLLGSGPFLFLFGAVGIALVVRHWKSMETWQVPALIYIAIFTALFFFHTSAASRFFLPVLPLLALFGARALRACPDWVRGAMLLFVAVVFARFTWLSTQPNTYQQASAYLAERSGSIVPAGIPAYFYELPTERFTTTEADAAYMLIQHDGKTTVDAPWNRCAQFIASTTTDDIVLLWNDTPWAYVEALHARSFGPNIDAYCRS